MKHIINSIFILTAFLSCSTNEKFEQEVVFFLQADEPELISDYEYHVGQIRNLYLDKDIKITEIKERLYRIGTKEISIKDDAYFAMLFIDKNGNHKIRYSFGTDVDMMMDVNEFFKIK